jgi:hypothetical protein
MGHMGQGGLGLKSPLSIKGGGEVGIGREQEIGD